MSKVCEHAINHTHLECVCVSGGGGGGGGGAADLRGFMTRTTRRSKWLPMIKIHDQQRF